MRAESGRQTVQVASFASASLPSSRSARQLIDKARLHHRGEETLHLDMTGVEMATLSVAFILLRSLRRFLEQCAATHVEVSGASAAVRRYLDEALALRFDLDHVEHDDGSLQLSLRFPAQVLDEASGRIVKIGSARRKMAAVIERDGPGCVWCGLTLSYFHPQATLDHVLPHSADGSQEVRNMVIACKRCNHSRSATPAERWLERCLAKGMAVNEQAVRQAIVRINTEPLLRRTERRAGQEAASAAA